MDDDSPATEPHGTEVRYHYSESLPEVLRTAGCSLLVSTYQAGQVVAVGVADGQPTFSFRRFERAMGLALDTSRPGGALAVAGSEQVWMLEDTSGLAARLAPAGRHDRCWLPRTSVVTGPIQCHEIAWGDTAGGGRELWVVNTAFSCLAGIDPGFSFVPRWRPPYVTDLVAQDRCHLNGLAMRDGAPAYVTAMAVSDAPAGWRAAGPGSGVVLEVPSGEPVTTGLAMPHSPRWHRGELFVLNSGMGRLERVDPADGRRDVVALLPGYARGLALFGDLAFVGLSRIRETAVFGNVPIAAYRDQLRCGVGVVELSTGTTVATLQFANGVEEIFDVQVAPGTRCPTLGSGDPAEEVWVLPASAASWTDRAPAGDPS